MSQVGLRARMASRFVEDLVGPLAQDEVLSDRPSQRYSTGILYPQGSRIEAEQDEDGGQATNVVEDSGSAALDQGVSLHTMMKPSVAGLSFAAQANQGEVTRVAVGITCAIYRRFAVDDDGQEVEGEPRGRKYERWRRLPLDARLSIGLNAGTTRLALEEQGIPGLELYVVVTPYRGLTTVTMALSNCRRRGTSGAYDEEQHFFQVELRVGNISGGEFAPRPSRTSTADDDSRTSALIYRNVREYVVGHTCSAQAHLEGGKVLSLHTTWLPMVVVQGVSDRGDPVFEALASDGSEQPLVAEWLAQAPVLALVHALTRVVEAYKRWIVQERAKIGGLPIELQAQANMNMKRCEDGAARMMEGIEALEADEAVRTAFQLSQAAMGRQFGWSRKGAALVWRPFQLAFQLLVLASLAERTHSDRDTMDLLWFPTGGGKTEAYLALTAFIIFLRRLRYADAGEGAGVAVLMRYTLRLLTVQQFQRAAAMILACELLRRRAGGSAPEGRQGLGASPIGIGLWVGAGATPLTLKEAQELVPGASSDPRQLSGCPCCGQPLEWRIGARGSVVECTTSADDCELAATGARLPVWTIDEEVYTQTPALLIATVDKFAQIVRNPATGVLFGLGTPYFAPDLIIQDELHLISGPLGSMAGLYECAVDELCRRDAIRPKIIGSTATIRRAEDQIRSLFDRSTYQFPAPGIDVENSGFAVTDHNHPGRLHFGISTAGRSATYMLQALIASLLQSASEGAWSIEERDAYWTLVAYFTSLRELGGLHVLMQQDVPESIAQIAGRRAEASRPIEAPAELTSRIRSYEIRDMLARLTHSVGDEGVVDLVVASNMISVGMDIPRLGLMVVNAQPKTLSEYIQATSRVGRGAVPGIVVTMYNNTRARDRSHFETFETWHRALYRDVEATSVTPFASRAQDKALHAVLVALVRHTVQGMAKDPVLTDQRRAAVEQLAGVIDMRVARIDPSEKVAVSQKLVLLIDEWAGRPDLQAYWDDYGHRISLLLSAEQFAAKADVDPDLETEGLRTALWPTPNSMREVEAGAPFMLRDYFKAEAT